jgi:hypothetical protein
VILSEFKSLLYTPKHLKNLVIKEMKKMGNGNDPNPSNEGCITVKQHLLTTSIG